jgi:ribonuclease D
MAIPENQLPPLALPGTGPPPPRLWADRDPKASARLAAARQELSAFADEHNVPLENLLGPDVLRRLVWTPPSPPTEEAVRAQLSALGARHWQVAIATPIIVKAFADEA